jgi:hypothetical protein
MFESPPAGTEVHMVRGEHSDRFTPAMIERMELAARRNVRADAGASAGAAARGLFHLHCLEKAGHWLHTDNSPGLSDIMLKHTKIGNEPLSHLSS